jgi:hypothetical protein
MMNFDESDQAGMIFPIFALHLQSKGHINGEPNPDCPFCKAFIIDDRPKDQQRVSSSFVILDISNPNDKIL